MSTRLPPAEAHDVCASLRHDSPCWARFATQEAVFWGFGNVLSIPTTNCDHPTAMDAQADRWGDVAAEAVRDALTERIGGPRLVYGRSFADGTPAVDWAPMGAERAFVPSICLTIGREEATVTVSRVAHPPHQQRASASPAPAQDLSRTSTPLLDEHQFRDRLEVVITALRRGAAEKVVLSRAVDLPGIADVGLAMQRLDALYPPTCRFAVCFGQETFLGATPELLCRVRGRTVRTMALAGSGTAQERDGLLLGDQKLRVEHEIVVQCIRGALAPHVARLTCDPEPRVVRLRNISHLRTDIEAELGTPMSALHVGQVLHPTPAVAGYPLTAATGLIDRLESLDRGWFTGVVGWVDAQGDGDLWVPLRCALSNPSRTRLFAGVGLTPDSDPDVELDETRWKLAAMHEALSGGGQTTAQTLSTAAPSAA